MKYKSVICSIIIIFFLYSCQNSSNETSESNDYTVIVSDTLIYGDFTKYASVVPGTYKLKMNELECMLELEFKFFKPCDTLWQEGLNFDKEHHKIFNGFFLELLDENGGSLGMNMEINQQIPATYEETEMLIKQLKLGEGSHLFTFYDVRFPTGETLATNLNKLSKVKISGFMIAADTTIIKGEEVVFDDI